MVVIATGDNCAVSIKTDITAQLNLYLYIYRNQNDNRNRKYPLQQAYLLILTIIIIIPFIVNKISVCGLCLPAWNSSRSCTEILKRGGGGARVVCRAAHLNKHSPSVINTHLSFNKQTDLSFWPVGGQRVGGSFIKTLNCDGKGSGFDCPRLVCRGCCCNCTAIMGCVK